jgi:hypothetical protein
MGWMWVLKEMFSGKFNDSAAFTVLRDGGR